MWMVNLVATLVAQAVLLYVTDCLSFLVVRTHGHEKGKYLACVVLFGIATLSLWYNLYKGNTMFLLLVTLLLVLATVNSGIKVNGGVTFGKGTKQGKRS